jgi:hypothetical protein
LQELELSLFTYFWNLQMAAVAGQAILSQLLRNDKRQTVVFPFAVTAGHRYNVGVAHVLKTLRRKRRANSSGAVDHDRRLSLRDGLFDADFEEPSGQENRAGQVPLIPLVLLADVEQNKVRAILYRGIDIMNADFANLLFYLRKYVFETRTHAFLPYSIKLIM